MRHQLPSSQPLHAFPWSFAAVVLTAISLLSLWAAAPQAQAGSKGQWSTLPDPMPINPIHATLTNDGKVLIIAGSGNVAAEQNFRATVWDPQADTLSTQLLPYDMFCNGMVTLPDGRVFVNGGNLKYDPFWGELRNAAYDPASGQFTTLEDMAHGRWYPTTTVLGDGRVMSFSGLKETGGTNTTVEIYTVGAGWSQEYPAGWTPPLYPRLHLLTNGTVFYSGPGRGSRIFNPSTNTWSAIVATTNYASNRNYGTSVLLPLSPADGYRSRVMILGGGNPATATTEIIDPSGSRLWQYGPPMSQPRIQLNATILPNGTVLAVGGSFNDEDAGTASLNADIYNPATNTFSVGAANVYPRLYHSVSLLLPDATVLLAGGNPVRGSYQTHTEIYSPAYLFNADGSPALRPTVTDVPLGPIGYDNGFQVHTPDAENIASVALVRPGAPTHAFDMDQRMVSLSYTSAAGVLTVTSPPNGNVAPPGYYMLFIVNDAGVPSVAKFVQLSASVANQPPTASITSPATNVTVTAGQSLFFDGTGNDPDGSITAYSWTFEGGTPAASSQANPGNVTYSTPGTYTASLTVTDNDGLTSLSPATRTIVVPDFTLSATPGSRSVLPGSSTSYTATVTGDASFSDTVDFSVSGLPSGVSASFTPGSVTNSGSTTLNVTTSPSVVAGTYQLVITGTSGPITHTAGVTLIVSGSFSISATPAALTIARGKSATYTVTVAADPGISGISFSVSGAPAKTTTRFKPTSVVNSGSSQLTVKTNSTVTPGTYTLTIQGTSGGQAKTVNVTLTVQ